MDEQGAFTCKSCPAFHELPGEGGAGTCRAAPPTPLQSGEYFRGSSRDLLFGSYPVVGAFPLVRGEVDFCMAHPKNRVTFAG
jgi:hypothetical protein